MPEARIIPVSLKPAKRHISATDHRFARQLFLPLCGPVLTDMTIALDGSIEAGNSFAYTDVSQGKRRKIERPDKQDVSEAANGMSKAERRLAKKSRRAIDRAERKNDEADVTGESRYIFTLLDLGTMLSYVQVDLQRPMPRKLPGGPKRGSMAKMMTLP